MIGPDSILCDDLSRGGVVGNIVFRFVISDPFSLCFLWGVFFPPKDAAILAMGNCSYKKILWAASVRWLVLPICRCPSGLRGDGRVGSLGQAHRCPRCDPRPAPISSYHSHLPACAWQSSQHVSKSRRQRNHKIHTTPPNIPIWNRRKGLYIVTDPGASIQSTGPSASAAAAGAAVV